MKPEMRHKLAQLTFADKIRKVGELIRLRRKIKTAVSNVSEEAALLASLDKAAAELDAGKDGSSMEASEHDRVTGARSGRQSTGLLGGRALREINARQDVRKYAAEHGLSESEGIESGMQEKRKEFLEKGAEVYAKT